MLFDNQEIRPDLLRKWSYNLRWATLPEDVIPLTAGDPDFRVAPVIREALMKYVSDGQFSYGPAEGLKSFRTAISRKAYDTYKISLDPDLILPVDSAAYGLYLTCKTLLRSGDEAIIFDPVDFLFRYSVEEAGAKAVPFAVPLSDGIVDFSGIEQLITSRTRLLCLCNPLNPTGKVFLHSELQQLGDIAEKHNLIIVSDEIWSDIIFRPHRFTPISALNQNLAKRTVTLTGFSKSYGLAGLRIGAIMVGDQHLYEEIFNQSKHQATIHGANVAGQVAATAALESGQDWLDEFVIHLERMKDLTITELNSMPGIKCHSPQGCYLAFPDVTGTGKTAEELYQLLLDRARIAVVPGIEKWFGKGAEGHIRLSFATSEKILSEALGRMKKTLLAL